MGYGIIFAIDISIHRFEHPQIQTARQIPKNTCAYEYCGSTNSITVGQIKQHIHKIVYKDKHKNDN